MPVRLGASILGGKPVWAQPTVLDPDGTRDDPEPMQIPRASGRRMELRKQEAGFAFCSLPSHLVFLQREKPRGVGTRGWGIWTCLSFLICKTGGNPQAGRRLGSTYSSAHYHRCLRGGRCHEWGHPKQPQPQRAHFLTSSRYSAKTSEPPEGDPPLGGGLSIPAATSYQLWFPGVMSP